MDQKQIEKIGELMQRTIKLNENAPLETYYGLDFSGHTKAVYFRKYTSNPAELYHLIYEWAYLDDDSLGRPLSAIERIIAAEEKKQKEAQNNGNDTL